MIENTIAEMRKCFTGNGDDELKIKSLLRCNRRPSILKLIYCRVESTRRYLSSSTIL